MDIRVLKKTLTAEEINRVIESIGGIPKDFLNENTYLGVKQIDYGFRGYNYKTETLRRKYNKWFKDNHQTILSAIERGILHLTGKEVKYSMRNSYPVFHRFTEAVPFEKGTHRDLGVYGDSYPTIQWQYLTILIPIILPNKGGRTTFIDDFFESHVKAQIGDMVIFSSEILHSVEEFNGDRLMMAAQFHLNYNFSHYTNLI